MTTAATHHHLSASAFLVPDKILVASDLTDIDYLIPHAISQCKACAASLVLGHVIPPVESESLEEAVYLVADVARQEAKRLLIRRGILLALLRRRCVLPASSVKW